jgi:hypothetical protein
MSHIVVLLTLVCTDRYDPGDAMKVVAVVRTAYKDNLAALSASGTIRFHSFDGKVGPAKGVDGIAALLNQSWKRQSRSEGLYTFDGANRRYEILYPPGELVARRVKTSATTWESLISSDRLLTDGDSTLMDNINVDADDKTVLHSPNIRAGPQHFFRLAEGNPLRLGDPDPVDYDMSRGDPSAVSNLGHYSALRQSRGVTVQQLRYQVGRKRVASVSVDRYPGKRVHDRRSARHVGSGIRYRRG